MPPMTEWRVALDGVSASATPTRIAAANSLFKTTMTVTPNSDSSIQTGASQQVSNRRPERLLRGHGIDMLHNPRPYVGATIVSPSGVSVRLFTVAFGRPDPKVDHTVGLPTPAANTPFSVDTTSSSPRINRSVAVASGRLPLMSFRVSPPSVDSKTGPPLSFHEVPCPTEPAERDVDLPGSTGSIRIARIHRSGSGSPRAGPATRCHSPPTFLSCGT